MRRTGLMDTKQQMLDLHKDIFLQTSTGYEARLSQAFVDMGKGTVTSDEHVDVKLTNGTLILRPAAGLPAAARWCGSKAMS